MEYSNKINLKEVFKELDKEIYVVAKKSEYFPNYYSGSDIDILCLDLKKVSQIIIKATNKYVKEGFRTEVTNNHNFSKVYLDFFNTNNDLDLRFDLSNITLDYKKVAVNPSYIYSILENRVKDESKVYIPSHIDDLIIKYLEYIEWFELRPDKVKHLDYILSQVKEGEEERKFLDKLHMYTKLSLLEVPADSHFGKSVVEDLNNTISDLKETEAMVMTELGYTNKVVEAYSREVEQIGKELRKSKTDLQKLISARSSRLLYYMANPTQIRHALKRKLSA